MNRCLDFHNFQSESNLYSYLKSKNFYLQDSQDIKQNVNKYVMDHELKKADLYIRLLTHKAAKGLSFESESKEIESAFAKNSNNKQLRRMFFDSRLFLKVVDSVDTAQVDSMPGLFKLIENMLKNSKEITRYLSLNEAFIRRVFKTMLLSDCFESCVKIIEELAINSTAMIRIRPLANLLEDVFRKYEETRLEFICRIFAVLIYDNKKLEERFSVVNSKSNPEPKTSYENLMVIFSLPDCVNKLLKCLWLKFKQVKDIGSLSSAHESLRVSVNSLNSNSMEIEDEPRFMSLIELNIESIFQNKVVSAVSHRI